MEPNHDPQLRALLKEWRAPETPASLEQRVLEQRRLRGITAGGTSFFAATSAYPCLWCAAWWC